MGSLHIMRGLPASGKTTEAKALLTNWIGAGLSVIRISRDDLRFMMHAANWQQKGEGFAKATEDRVTDATHALLREFLGNYCSVIYDACNLHPQGVIDLAADCRDYGAESVMLHEAGLDVSLDECIARNEARRGTEAYIPSEVINSMADRYDLKKMGSV